MPSKLIGLALLGVATASAASTCPAQPRSEAGVIATEEAWVAALEHRNPAALNCILDPSFSDNDWQGQHVPRAEVLARLGTRPASQLHLSDLEARVEGTMAVVRGLNRQTGADGKVSGAVRFTDVFFYRGGRWRAIAAQETLVRTKASP